MILIYTVCKGRAYQGSAEPGLRYISGPINQIFSILPLFSEEDSERIPGVSLEILDKFDKFGIYPKYSYSYSLF